MTESVLLSTVIAFAIAVTLTPLMRVLSLRVGLMDVPNERSSHAVPTPRSGGVAILVGAIAAVVLSGVAREPLKLFLPAAIVIAATGFIDDLRGLSAQLRLVVQCVSAIAVVVLGGFVGIAAGGFLEVLLVAIAVFWIVGVTNAYNFMDGINGIASVEAMACATALCILSTRTDDPHAAVVAAAIGGAAAGFLPWNYPKAKIFMGDVASGTIGFAFAVLVIRHGTVGGSLVAAALPLLPFLADTAATLVRRVVRGERIFQAHRSHFYQRLTAAGAGHTKATLVFGALAFAGAYLSVIYGGLTPRWRVAALAGYCLLHVVLAFAIIALERRARARAQQAA